MALSYNRMWKLLVDKKNEQSGFEESCRYCSEYNDKAPKG